MSATGPEYFPVASFSALGSYAGAGAGGGAGAALIHEASSLGDFEIAVLARN